jgi:hypothetical protein
MTVEIGYAVVTAAFLAALVLAAFWVPTLVVDAAPRVEHAVRVTGAVAAAAAGVWRVVRVLTKFDASRRLGR